jgi:hypothetical protein
MKAGDLTEAERIAVSYSPPMCHDVNTVDPFSKESKDAWRQAFAAPNVPLIKLPKEFGKFCNSQLVREGFVAFMGEEKIGKTYIMMELAMRGKQNGCNVAFFQAGDMTEKQLIRRLGIYLAKRSDQKRYCKEMWVPVVDCRYSQMDTCDRKERECDSGIADMLPKSDSDEITLNILMNAYKEYPDYKPCHNCTRGKGAVWIEPRHEVEPLTWKEAYKKARSWRRRHQKRFKLCTYPNETLTVSEMKSKLDMWERQENFITDIVVVDYADLLAVDPDCKRLDFRHQQNKVWQRLRRLSEEKHILVITATQTSARGYGKKLLTKKDFSEDKRKFAHVTAMYGLNQTDAEKKIGILRLNEIVLREGEFSVSNQVTLLQRLQQGRPYLGSFR